MTYNWKKSALIAAAMILGAYLCLAVTALNQPDDEKAVCTQVDIVIADGKVDGFLGASEIKEQPPTCQDIPARAAHEAD